MKIETQQTMRKHWTTAMRAENAALKAENEAFRQIVWSVIQGRVDKNNFDRGNWDRYQLGYQAALQETVLRIHEAESDAHRRTDAVA